MVDHRCLTDQWASTAGQSRSFFYLLEDEYWMIDFQYVCQSALMCQLMGQSLSRVKVWQVSPLSVFKPWRLSALSVFKP
jgi:hypothetical protein